MNKTKHKTTNDFTLRPIHFVGIILLLLIFSTIIVGLDKTKNSKEAHKNSENTKSYAQKTLNTPNAPNTPTQELKRLVSPEGEALLMRIKTPDRKFKKVGEYKVILRCASQTEALEKFTAQVKDILDTYHKEKEKELGMPLPKAEMPWKKTQLDVAKTENQLSTNSFKDNLENHYLDITFREKESYKSSEGKTVRTSVEVFDSNAEIYQGWVHRGATIKVSCDVVPYYNPQRGVGVTLRLKAIQFIRGTPPPKTNAENFGFEGITVEENWTDPKERVNKNSKEAPYPQ
jgi:hypothetical protein